jgi:hypothetical protein
MIKKWGQMERIELFIFPDYVCWSLLELVSVNVVDTSTLQIVFLFLAENNLFKGSYPPQGGIIKNTRQASLSVHPAEILRARQFYRPF